MRPIREAVKLAETVASGDLTHQIDATTNDETGQLLRALRHMNDSLVRIQQNAALVEESAAATSMQEQAAKLAQVVGVFKPDGRAAAAPVPVRAVAVVAKPAARVRKEPVMAAAKPAARAKAEAEEWEAF